LLEAKTFTQHKKRGGNREGKERHETSNFWVKKKRLIRNFEWQTSKTTLTRSSLWEGKEN